MSGWKRRSEGCELNPHPRPLSQGERGAGCRDENVSKKKQFARFLRKHQTPAEEKMWRLLRNNQFKCLKFRRQHVVEGFVVDFYCDRCKFAVEIDGEIHDRQKDYDAARDEVLASKGISLLRISNSEVEKDEEAVKRRISECIEKLSPSPSGRGALKDS